VSRERWRWRGSVALVAVALGLVIYPLTPQADVVNSDWPAFATGARLIVENPAHLYDFDAQRKVELQVTGGRVLVTLGIEGILPFLAPAWVAIFAVPFELLGTDAGGRIWILFGLALLAAGLWLAIRPRPPSAILPALASVPTALVMLNAQLDGWVVLGIGGALALWRRPFFAGLALGLTLVKPQLVLPLGFALLLARRWTMVAGWAVAGLALLGASLALSPHWVLDWLPALSTPVRTGSREVDLAHFGVYAPAGAQAYAVIALSLIALAVTLWIAARCRQDFGAAAAVLVAGGVVVSPHALPADLALVGLALAIWGQARWIEWLLLSVIALVAALAPPPIPSAAGVLLIGWLLLRISGWRRAPAQASAG
jgi:hypothetical protein